MINYHRAAQVLIATWKLASDNNKIPSSDGVLDKILKLSIEDGAFGNSLGELHFIESPVGTQCVELSNILNMAQAAELTQDPNPSYIETHIKISSAAAKRRIKSLKIEQETVSQWGEILMKNANLVKTDFYQSAL